jgi:MFS family permease
VWHLGLIYVAFGFSYIIYMTFFTKYLISEGEYTQASAGRLFMLMGWLSLLCGLIWGSFSDKFGRKTALVIVYIIQAAAFGLFASGLQLLGSSFPAILFGLRHGVFQRLWLQHAEICSPRLAPAGLGFITLFLVSDRPPSQCRRRHSRCQPILSPRCCLLPQGGLISAVGSCCYATPHPQHNVISD